MSAFTNFIAGLFSTLKYGSLHCIIGKLYFIFFMFKLNSVLNVNIFICKDNLFKTYFIITKLSAVFYIITFIKQILLYPIFRSIHACI